MEEKGPPPTAVAGSKKTQPQPEETVNPRSQLPSAVSSAYFNFRGVFSSRGFANCSWKFANLTEFANLTTKSGAETRIRGANTIIPSYIAPMWDEKVGSKPSYNTPMWDKKVGSERNHGLYRKRDCSDVKSDRFEGDNQNIQHKFWRPQIVFQQVDKKWIVYYQRVKMKAALKEEFCSACKSSTCAY